ncbi:head-to-tail connector complex protein [Gordonia phage Trine]|uniref:Head-to-tail stopper n=1 Tax=Gordonia phage Trine TaxID=2201431 RepID=A0A2Z4Q969_9CAUD|nr:head-to-tail connector complex protein [Gordonia phage Trine]AWY06510.1 head-to-tail stopper [Gordonia phage Trine]
MEYVTRVRAAGRDENDDPIPGGGETQLRAMAVFPGSSSLNADRGRNGRQVAYTVHFYPAVDLQEGDRLRVRGVLCDTIINDWRSPRTGRRLQEVLCSEGKG